MKLNQKYRIVISILGVIAGWLSIGIGYGTKIGHPINTILFLGGILIFFISGIWFFLTAIKS